MPDLYDLLRVTLSNMAIFRNFYESYAFMLDNELTSLLLDACAGLLIIYQVS